MKSLIFLSLLCLAMADHKGYEEPPFKVIKHPETFDFEERLYEGGMKWACTDNTNGTSRRHMFWRLFGYISGDNAENKTMSMAVPVKTKMTKPSNLMDSANFPRINRTMCFFLGKDNQKNPPQPNDEHVYIETMPQISVFTRKLGGWMWESDWLKERRALTNMVTKAGMKIDNSYFYACGYDSPFTFWHRRNEVWLVKKDKKGLYDQDYTINMI